MEAGRFEVNEAGTVGRERMVSWNEALTNWNFLTLPYSSYVMLGRTAEPVFSRVAASPLIF